jgi:hypothetical protein
MRFAVYIDVTASPAGDGLFTVSKGGNPQVSLPLRVYRFLRAGTRPFRNAFHWPTPD